MTNFKYHRIMHQEIAKRNRNCMLCNMPIEKKQKCWTVVISGKVWPTRLHIHKYHVKPMDIKKCKDRLKCLTGEHYCNSPICKNRRPW